MRKKLKGSALLWAVCSLLIIAFVLTGILALTKSYAQTEIENAAGRRAEYLARSGVELTADIIAGENLLEGQSTYEGIDRYTEVVVTYEWGEVRIERTSGDRLRLISEASAGNIKRSVTGIMEYTLLTDKWELKGYVTK